MKGYKAFDSNLKCRGFQYEVGGTYTLDGRVEMCFYGFHFCERPGDLKYYYPVIDSRICEVEALGTTIIGADKSVTDKIKILREIVGKERVLLVSGNGHGHGHGYSNGDGYGNGNSYGYSYGNGDGYGYGYSNGDGYGYGYSNSYGYSYGNGDGYGYSYGNGDGYGYGYSNGDGYGYKNKQRVFM